MCPDFVSLVLPKLILNFLIIDSVCPFVHSWIIFIFFLTFFTIISIVWFALHTFLFVFATGSI